MNNMTIPTELLENYRKMVTEVSNIIKTMNSKVLELVPNISSALVCYIAFNLSSQATVNLVTDIAKKYCSSEDIQLANKLIAEWYELLKKEE